MRLSCKCRDFLLNNIYCNLVQLQSTCDMSSSDAAEIAEEELQEKFKNQFTQTLIECQPQLSKEDFIEMLKERIAQDSEMTREENTTTIAEENTTIIANENAATIAEDNATTIAKENTTIIADENAEENATLSMQDA